jgi:serine/threonine protein kinase
MSNILVKNGTAKIADFGFASFSKYFLGKLGIIFLM